jgi:hypothetical protein
MADINHTLVSYRTRFGKDVRQGWICGGTAKLWGIEAFLSAGLNFPVQPFSPFKDISLREEQREIEEIRFGETLGRALVYTRKGGLTFNFRKDSLSKENSLKEITEFFSNPAVLRMGQALAILVAMLFVHVHVAQRFARNDEELAANEVKKIFADTFRSAPKNLRNSLTADPEALRKFIDQKNVELAAKIKMLSQQKTPALNYLLMVSESFPTEVKIDVNHLQLDEKAFSLEGVLYEGDLKAVDELLKKNKAFTGLSLTNSGQRFSIKGQIVRN